MKNNNIELDITSNIKCIEQLKCQLLSQISELYMSLADSRQSPSDRNEALANIIIVSYLLASRLNINNTVLDQKIINQLKLGVLEENVFYNDMVYLLKHMGENR